MPMLASRRRFLKSAGLGVAVAATEPVTALPESRMPGQQSRHGRRCSC